MVAFETMFMLVVFGDLVGVPIMPPYYGMRLLPFVVEANVRALQMREPNSTILKRYDEVAQLLTGRLNAHASDAIEWLQQIESQSLDALVANLFLHHFNNEQLQELFSEAARTARVSWPSIRIPAKKHGGLWMIHLPTVRQSSSLTAEQGSSLSGPRKRLRH